MKSLLTAAKRARTAPSGRAVCGVMPGRDLPPVVLMRDCYTRTRRLYWGKKEKEKNKKSVRAVKLPTANFAALFLLRSMQRYVLGQL